MEGTKEIVLYSFAVTDIGRKRKHNEDTFLRDDELGLYIVADGMGGYAGGEVASSEAVTTVHDMIKRNSAIIERFIQEPTKENAHYLQRIVESAVQNAAYLIFGLAEVMPEKHGMGTTISLLLIAGSHGVIAQVGDSRIYKIKNGEAFQLTEDHTLINWQLKSGLITPEQAQNALHKNIITRAVGSKDYVEVDLQIFPVEKGDGFMLCSDGLHGYINDTKEIVEMFNKGIEEGARAFIELANQRGGKDNITCIFVKVE